MPVHDAVLIHIDRKGAREKIETIKTIMSEAAFKVIGTHIKVDTKLITHAFRQEEPHQERWNILYEKLLKAKKEVA